MILKYCDIDLNLRDNWGRSVVDLASSTNKQLLLKHGTCIMFLNLQSKKKTTTKKTAYICKYIYIF